MSTDWENVLLGWTKPASATEETRCDNAVTMIKNAIKADPALSKIRIDIYAQGSYANDTNVKANSDVDVIVCNMDTIFPKYPTGKTDKDLGLTDSDYAFPIFKDQVGATLRNYFGEGHITRGRKAFDIKSTSYRVEADAVPCYEYRRYDDALQVNGQNGYYSGIKFIPDGGTEIISYPRQHNANGIRENAATNKQFKKVVRIFRKLNYVFQDQGIPIGSKMTGYILECLCWNVPDELLRLQPYLWNVKNVLAHLRNSTAKKENVDSWKEISELKWLFRGDPESKREEAYEWLTRAWTYIGFQ